MINFEITKELITSTRAMAKGEDCNNALNCSKELKPQGVHKPCWGSTRIHFPRGTRTGAFSLFSFSLFGGLVSFDWLVWLMMLFVCFIFSLLYLSLLSLFFLLTSFSTSTGFPSTLPLLLLPIPFLFLLPRSPIPLPFLSFLFFFPFPHFPYLHLRL